MPGPGNTAGEAIVNHSKIDKIAFTGSTNVGKNVMKGAADEIKMSH